MFAIAEIAGKQYKISEKDKFLVDKLDRKEGDKVIADKVLLYVLDNDVEVGMPYLPYEVELKVLEHVRGDKIRVFKMKSKKRYAKTYGHRQEYTEVEVVKIIKVTPKKEVEKKGEVKAEKVVKKVAKKAEVLAEKEKVAKKAEVLAEKEKVAKKAEVLARKEKAARKKE